MCRNIRVLRNFDPPTTDDEVREAALQFVRKVSGSTHPSRAIGRDSTVPLVARKGRASYLGERSAGHLDPGAASATILVQTLADTLGDGGSAP